jgi:hypothetical protein
MRAIGVNAIWCGVASIIVALTISTGPALAAGDANSSSCPAGTEASPGFRTYLPDCRAYEMVSPRYKQASPAADPELGDIQVSRDGSRVISHTFAAFAGGENNEGHTRGTSYEFVRGGVGWEAVALDPPASLFPMSFMLESVASPDLGESVWSASTSQAPTEFGVYVEREPAPGSAPTPTLVGPERPQPSIGGREVAAVGASNDLTHLLLAINTPTGEEEAKNRNHGWPGDTTLRQELATLPSLYEYVGTGNSEPTLIGVKNEGRLAGQPHVNEGAELVSECGTELGSATGSRYNAVSASGKSVFFTARGTDSLERCATAVSKGMAVAPEANELYARGDQSKTVAISEPTVADCELCDTEHREDAIFQGASEDGSKAFFLSRQRLLSGAAGRSLYEYDFDRALGQRVTLVAPDVLGVARISENGARVYFVTEGDQLELYDTLTGSTTHVASLAPTDEEDWKEFDSRPVQATPDGRFLVFPSSAHLTGAEDTSTTPQLFEYDAQENVLVRISRGQSGFNNNGNTTEAADAPRIPSPNFAISNPAAAGSNLAVSADGAVTFMSADGLTPQAANNSVAAERLVCVLGKEFQQLCEEQLPPKEFPEFYILVPTYAQNVYEYRPLGGSIAEGNVYLISDGRDLAIGASGRSAANLIGMDTSGGDILLETADALVPQDSDTQIDIYDARIGGGFPGSSSPSSCAGDACQGPLAPVPPFSPAGSATQAGGDNLLAVPTGSTAKAKPKRLTRAQKLGKALRACKKAKSRKRRARCQALARQHYGSAKATSTKKSKGAK